MYPWYLKKYTYYKNDHKTIKIHILLQIKINLRNIFKAK